MNRIRPGLIVCLAVTLFFGLALWLRVSPPFDKIFTSAGIRFSTVDAYYYMYLVDNLAHNFPHLSTSLPYLDYPGGQVAGSIRFFATLLAAVIWIVSLGNPTQHTIDVVSVYYPAVLGALTVIPVYFIGRTLMGRWAGIIAAGLIAIIPGEFLGRSILGSTDHHIAESLFTAVTMLFLILALKAARERQLTFEHFKRQDWATIIKPMVFGLLAGVFLVIYRLTFIGSLLFVFIISLYFVVQTFIDHLRRESTDYLSLISLAFLLVESIMFLPVVHSGLNLISLVVWLVPLVLNRVSKLMTIRQLKPVYFPLTIVGLGLVAGVAILLIAPSLFQPFSVFFPTGASLTTLEMQRILSPSGSFTFALVWGNFTASFFLTLISLMLLITVPKSSKSWISFFVILIIWISLLVVGERANQAVSILLTILTNIGLLACLVIRQKDADKSLLVVWSLVILAATVGQRRFAYYFAVNVAVLTGFVTAWVFEKCSLTKLTSKNENALITITMGIIAILFLLPTLFLGFLNTLTWIGIPALIVFFVALFFGQREQIKKEITVRRAAPIKSGFHISRFNISTAHVNLVLALLLVFLVAFFPNIGAAHATAAGASFAPTDAWMESLAWLKENTPEPFGDPDYYYQLTANTSYPESAYGVLSWWDYGYWITRIAHRIPNVNPSQDAVLQNKVGTIFTSQNETLANEIVRELGTAYVVIDDQTALGKFWAVVTWAGKSPSEFTEVFYIPQQNQATPVQLFYPEYYRSLVIRLYNFDGKAVTLNQTTSNQTFVISYEDRTIEGRPIKLITSAQSFGSMPGYSTTLSSAQIASLAQWLKGSPPASPSGLNATAINAGQINLNWQENSTDEAGFRIERAADNTFATGLVTIATTAPNAVSYNDTTASGNATYYYRIYAFNSAGDSAASNTASATTPVSSVLPPAAVSGLSATAISSTQVNLNWVDNADSKTGVRIERATNNTFSASLTSVNVAANTTSFRDTVSGNTTYYYRVYAFNSGGSSVASNIASSTTPGEMLNASVLYTNNCASCHGANRQGGNAPALTSSALVSKTPAQVTTSVTNGISSYQQAEAYRIAKNSDKYRIVGVNPFLSPVPLEAVQDYKLVYNSTQALNAGAAGLVPQIKIFQFTGNSTGNTTANITGQTP